MNLISAFATQAQRHEDRIAIIDGRGRTITYGDLLARSSRLAGAWRAAGLKTGDRVLLAMGIGIDLYVALAAAWRIGAVVVFPEPALGLPGLRHAVRATNPRAFLSCGWYRLLGWALPDLRRLPLRLTPHDGGEDAMHVEDIGGEHPALVSFTSGSTGTPKAIQRTHGFLASQNACVASLIDPRGAHHTDLVAFPVFVVANLGLGVTSVLPNWNVRRHDRADPARIARHMSRHGITRALLPPSICERLCRLDALPPLAAIFTGGGPVFPDVMQRLSARLPGADIVAVYGSTEAEPIAHLRMRDITQADWTAMREGAGLLTGTPIREITLQLRDGEILVAGDHVNSGYLDSRDDADNKIRDGARIWHRTGDAGHIDEAGRLWLLGRHAAKVGELYPFAIEVAARSWPGVRRAALVGSGNRAVLAIEGEHAHAREWQDLAQRFGEITVAPVEAIPLDRRHRSKVDLPRLKAMLGAR